MSQEIENGLARWSWLRVSHEVTVQISDGAAVICKLNCDWRIYFKVRSVTWLIIWCWLLAEGLGSSPCGPFYTSAWGTHVQRLDLLSCLKQQTNKTKYMKQQFSDPGHQTMQHSDPWDKESKWSKPYICPASSMKSFQAWHREKEPRRSLGITWSWRDRARSPRRPRQLEFMGQRARVERLMGFKICYPKMWHLGILYILSWKSSRKQQKQECHSDLSPAILSRNRSENPHVGGTFPRPEGKRYLYLLRKRDTEKNLNEHALLNFTSLLQLPRTP